MENLKLTASSKRPATEFGKWLRAKREARGWTQVRTSRELKVSAAALSFLETGYSRYPTSRMLDRMKEVLGDDYPKDDQGFDFKKNRELVDRRDKTEAEKLKLNVLLEKILLDLKKIKLALKIED